MAGSESAGGVIQKPDTNTTRPSSEKDGRVVLFVDLP